MRRRACCGVAAGLAALASGALFAQADHARVAVPWYRPEDVVQGLLRHWQLPRAAAFVTAAQQLAAAVRQGCASGGAAAARPAWIHALESWERLATVPLGALIERRALRTLDFQPARPELIPRAIARAPRGAEAMQRIGTPAKGLPALEWLLWAQPAAAGSPACDYAAEVADEIAREAAAVHAAVDASASAERDEAAATAAYAELLNQWVGAVERLRWTQIDKPRKEAATRRRRPDHPRQASGQTGASWARQWAVLQELALFNGTTPPRPGDGLVPIETLLRSRGNNALADRWRRQVQQAATALRAADPARNDRLDAAVRTLAATRTMAEAELAPALEVRMGFSDADGD